MVVKERTTEIFLGNMQPTSVIVYLKMYEKCIVKRRIGQ